MDSRAGVYIITMKDRFYIGRATSLHRRRLEHLNDLKSHRHSNNIMQRSWNKHRDFSFAPLLICEVEETVYYEQVFLDAYFKEETCMNMIDNAGGGNTRPAYGEAHGMYNNTKFHFAHQNGAEEYCTQYFLREKYNLCSPQLSMLVKGGSNRLTIKGWWLVKSIEDLEEEETISYRDNSLPTINGSKKTHPRDFFYETVDSVYPSPDILLIEQEDLLICRDAIAKSLHKLDKRQQLIYDLRIVNESHTLQEIGDILRVTGERVRQLQNAALEILLETYLHESQGACKLCHGNKRTNLTTDY